MSQHFPQIHYILMFALGLGGITYYHAALERGWGTGRFMANSTSLPMVMAFASVVAAILLTIFKLGWIKLLITVFGGYALMAILLSVFKTKFQVLVLSLFVLTPIAIVWGVKS